MRAIMGVAGKSKKYLFHLILPCRQMSVYYYTKVVNFERQMIHFKKGKPSKIVVKTSFKIITAFILFETFMFFLPATHSP